MGKINDIIEILATELAAGKYPVGSRFPSEYDLAERFDTGRVTVNKAVSHLVTLGKLERGARGSGTRVKAQTIYPKSRVVFLGSFVHMFCATLLQGVMTAASFRDYGVEIAMPGQEELPKFLDKICRSGQYAGIVTHDAATLDHDRWPLPTVYIDTCNPTYNPDCYHVANNNFDGARLLAKAVIDRGHHDVVIYTNCDYLTTHRYYRVKGFLHALEQAGLDRIAERLFIGMTYSAFDAATMLKKIRRSFPLSTVILTPTDDLAVEMARVLRREKINDMHVTGFGNVPGISDAYNLASTDQHPFHLGTDACNLLLDIYEQKPGLKPHVQYVDVEPVNLEALPFMH